MLETGQSSFQLVEETTGIRSRSSAMAEALVELAEVAMRIQMLALNASIEAAHARQFGAGFAIVAGEVQKLAVRSSRISDQISGLVRETESALERTAAQVELIASKDLNEVIRSKQMADAMVKALETSDRSAQELVRQMEQVNREVRDQLTIAHSALQFEDIVHQLLGSVAAGSEQLAQFALRGAALAGEVELGQRPMADLLAQATLDFVSFGQELDDPEPSSESLSQIELF
jgi:methyl-accepting chemotaxis protein